MTTKMTSQLRIISVNAKFPDIKKIEEAASILCSGGLVAFPTETVYGLGADSTNISAVKRLDAVKGRPANKPYTLLIYSCQQVEAKVANIPLTAIKLMEKFWPGPLTIVLKADNGKMIGFRLPDSEVALAFLRAAQVPIAAPSANTSGNPPPTDAQTVIEALPESFDCLLDGGTVRIGEASSVISVIGEQVEILREGAIDRIDIMNTVN